MNAEPSRVRVLTWNVHSFIGRRGVADVDPVLNAINDLDADIVALQEVDERPGEPEAELAFDALRKAFDRPSAEARTIRSADGDYGHLLMSRWPMHDSQLLDLAVARREPRMAISCRVEAPGGEIRVVAAHLGLRRRERRYQIGIIRGHLQTETESAAIVLGDFNDWSRRGTATKALCPPFDVAAAPRSYPSRCPVLPLDRIWCRRPLVPVGRHVSRAYRDLSDHLPVIADLGFDHAEP